MDFHTNDNIDQTVDHLIDMYRQMLGCGGVCWSAVREGLEIVCGDLESVAPEHHAVARLHKFIAAEDAKAKGGPARRAPH